MQHTEADVAAAYLNSLRGAGPPQPQPQPAPRTAQGSELASMISLLARLADKPGQAPQRHGTEEAPGAARSSLASAFHPFAGQAVWASQAPAEPADGLQKHLEAVAFWVQVRA